MRIALLSIIAGMLVLAGCAKPGAKGAQWHNSLYKGDFKNSMEKYYSRDFKICLNIAISAASAATKTQPGMIERDTFECLRQGGWRRI